MKRESVGVPVQGVLEGVISQATVGGWGSPVTESFRTLEGGCLSSDLGLFGSEDSREGSAWSGGSGAELAGASLPSFPKGLL